MTEINHGDAARYMKARELDIADPRNVTQHAAQARMLALGLTGKKRVGKGDTDRASKVLVFLHANPDYDPDAETPADEAAIEADGIDDPRTEDGTDGSSHEIEDGDADDAQPDATPTDDEASDDPSEDEEGAAKGSSVVPKKYRDEYKARGDARGNGDWLQRLLKCLLGPKKKLDIEGFERICEMNEVDISKYVSPEKQLTNGWQGRARMTGRNLMAPRIAAEAAFLLPADIWERSKDKLYEAGFDPEEDQPEADVFVMFRPSDEFISANIKQE